MDAPWTHPRGRATSPMARGGSRALGMVAFAALGLGTSILMGGSNDALIEATASAPAGERRGLRGICANRGTKYEATPACNALGALALSTRGGRQGEGAPPRRNWSSPSPDGCLACARDIRVVQPADRSKSGSGVEREWHSGARRNVWTALFCPKTATRCLQPPLAICIAMGWARVVRRCGVYVVSSSLAAVCWPGAGVYGAHALTQSTYRGKAGLTADEVRELRRLEDRGTCRGLSARR